jgi:hypothetical protein
LPGGKVLVGLDTKIKNVFATFKSVKFVEAEMHKVPVEIVYLKDSRNLLLVLRNGQRLRKRIFLQLNLGDQSVRKLIKDRLFKKMETSLREKPDRLEYFKKWHQDVKDETSELRVEDRVRGRLMAAILLKKKTFTV